MTIQELTMDDDEWIETCHERVIVKDMGGTVYYDGGDLQVMEYDCYVSDDDFPEWCKRPILMCHHEVDAGCIGGYERKVEITII